MGDFFDNSALKWVKGELDDTLRQASQALELYVEVSQDRSDLERCQRCLHQVAGVLRMLELSGAGMLAEEMEHTCDALLDDQIPQKENAYEVLMAATLVLPDYLERLQGGQKDLPIVLLPQLNDLRAARGAGLLTESAFFNPNLERLQRDAAAPLPEGAGQRSEETARKMRHHFQRGLLEVYKQQKVAIGLQILGQVLQRLQKTSDISEVQEQWRVSAGLVKVLGSNDGQASLATKPLLGQMDRQIRRLIEKGEVDLAESPNLPLLKNALYYIATSKEDTEELRSLRADYGLEAALPSEEEVESARDHLHQPNNELVTTVRDAIREQISTVKDGLDLYVRGAANEHLQEHADTLTAVADTLGMLGRDAVRQAVAAQADALRELDARDNQQPDEVAVMEVASQLLVVEGRLDLELRGDKSEPAAVASEPVETGDQQALMESLLHEVTVEMSKSKEAVLQLLDMPNNRDYLEQVQNLHYQISGALTMMGEGRIAGILTEVGRYLQEGVLEAPESPSDDNIDTLADVITGVEYYLETLRDGGPKASSLLDDAEHALSGLLDGLRPLLATDDAVEEELIAEPHQDTPVEPEITPSEVMQEAEAVAEAELVEQSEEIIAETPLEAPASEPIEEPAAVPEAVVDETPSIEPAVPEEPVAVDEADAVPPEIAAIELPEDRLDDEIVDIFIEEAGDELIVINRELPRWQANPEIGEPLKTIRRSFHTLKGSGRLVGALIIGEMAWSIENMLNRIIDESISTTPDITGLVAETSQLLPGLIQSLIAREQPEVDVRGIIARAQHLADPASQEGLNDTQEHAAEAQTAAALVDALEEEPEVVEPEETDTAAVESIIDEPIVDEAIDLSSALPDEPPAELESVEETIELLSPEPELEEVVAEVADLPDERASTLEQAFAEMPAVLEPLNPAVDTDTLSDAEDSLGSDDESDLPAIDAAELEIEAAADSPADSVDEPAPMDLAVEELANDELLAAPEEIELAEISDDAQPEELSETLDSPVDEAPSDEEPAPLWEAENALEEAFFAEELGDVSEPEELVQEDAASEEPLDDGPAWDLNDALGELPKPAGGAEPSIQEPVATDEELSAELDELVAGLDEPLLDETSQAEADSAEEESAAEEPVLSFEISDLSGGLSVEEPEEPQEAESLEADADEQPEPIDPVLYEIFKTETIGHIAEVREFLNGCDSLNGQGRLNDAVIRSLHTMQGSAYMAGVLDIATLSSELERSSKILHARDLPLNGLRLGVYNDVISQIERALDELSDHSLAGQRDDSEILERIAELPNMVDAAAPIVDTAPPVFEPPPQPVDEPSQDDDDELLAIFLEEGAELLERIQDDWELLLADPDAKSCEELLRLLHTLKGSARLAGINSIADLGHALETTLTQIDMERIPFTALTRDTVQQTVDRFAELLQASGHGDVSDLQDALEALGDAETHAAYEAVAAVDAPADEPEEPPAVEPEESIVEAVAEIPEPVVSETAAVPLAEPLDVDEDLLEIFVEEGHELLEVIEEVIETWHSQPGEYSLIERLQRALHTLKGSARLAGIEPIGSLCHSFESLLTAIVGGRLQVSAEIISVAQHASDRLLSQVDAAANHQPLPSSKDLLTQIEKVIAQDEDAFSVPVAPEPIVEVVDTVEAHAEQSDDVAAEAPAQSAEAPSTAVEPQQDTIAPVVDSAAQAQEQVRIRAGLLDDLVNNAGEVSIYRARLEEQNSMFQFNVRELEQTIGRLQDQLRKLEIETEAQILFRYEKEQDEQAEEFDPLELDRYSLMQQLSRSLVESVSDLGNIHEAMDNLTADSETLLRQQARVNTDLQESLMRTRMVPFSSIFTRLRRVVRQTSEQMGRQTELVIDGAGGEMDRNILEHMIAPLEHMLRNAVAHGIETPDVREAVGKPVGGQIRLALGREGNQVTLDVTDDGRGVDVEAVRNKAEELGMISADQGGSMTDRDIIRFIMEPGFTTAAEVSQIAGRGVGMDVVNSEIKQLGGSVDIDSEMGKGTRFSVRLPFTLAISQALLVTVAEEIFAIPHTSIEGVVRIPRDQLERCYQGGDDSYEYAGQNYDIRYLGYLLGMGDVHLDPAERWLPVLLVRAGDQRVALQVDGLLGAREIVVKSVGRQLSSVSWISGGTVLADGNVALIIDVAALVRIERIASLMDDVAEPAVEQRGPVTVMVVDDSLTVRKVTTRLLERNDMQVLTAKDGVDAVSQLQDVLPDVMLLDIEMPRMDGYELARHMRNTDRLHDVPIIMITSRTGDKHRQKAMDLGVNRYLGKPYQESELMQNIKELAGVVEEQV